MDQRHDEHLNCSLFPVSSSLICLCYLSIGFALVSVIMQTKYQRGARQPDSTTAVAEIVRTDVESVNSNQCAVINKAGVGSRYDKGGYELMRQGKTPESFGSFRQLDAVTLWKLVSKSFSISWHRVTCTLSHIQTSDNMISLFSGNPFV